MFTFFFFSSVAHYHTHFYLKRNLTTLSLDVQAEYKNNHVLTL